MPTMTRESLSQLARVNLTIEPEIRCPYEDFDEADTEWINTEMTKGNQWAWCVVTVYADYDGCRGIASLGGCSYESREAFDAAGETEQLTSEALDDLWSQLVARALAGRAKTLALSASRAIVTRFGYNGQNQRSVIAICDVKQISIPWDNELSPDVNHATAALRLMDIVRWTGDLVMGRSHGDGYVFVQIPKSTQ